MLDASLDDIKMYVLDSKKFIRLYWHTRSNVYIIYEGITDQAIINEYYRTTPITGEFEWQESITESLKKFPQSNQYFCKKVLTHRRLSKPMIYNAIKSCYITLKFLITQQGKFS